MNWEDLQVLHAAADCASISKAARKIGLSQPQMSRRLKSIEQSLGKRLFERMPTGIKPTAETERLLPLLEDVANAAASVIKARPQSSDVVRGTVRISAEATIANFIAIHARRLLEDLPQVELEVLTSHAEVSLSRREADILIRACLPDGGSLICRKLGELDYAIYGNKKYLQTFADCSLKRRLRDSDWVSFAEDRLFFPEQKKWLDSRLQKTPKFRATEMSTLVNAIAGNMGLGIVPCFIGDQDSKLSRVTPPIDEIKTRYYLLAQREILRDQAVNEIKQRLVDLFEDYKDLLTGIN